MIRISPDVVAAAKALGCTHAELEENRSGAFRVACSCGYTSTYRRTRPLAMEALAHHLAKVTNAKITDGVSLRDLVGGPR